MGVTGDLFGQSRRMRAIDVLGAPIERGQASRAEPGGPVSVLSVGGATLAEMPAPAHRVWHARQGVACQGDTLRIYRQYDGIRSHEGGSGFVVAAGPFAPGHSELSLVANQALEADFHLRVVIIPLASCKMLVGHEQDLAARPLAIEPGPAALFASYFESFVAQAPCLTGAAAEVAVQTLAQLAIAAYGMADPSEEYGRSKTRSGLLQNAMHTIESNIQRPDLSPSVMAGLLCISVRRLHVLFEPTGFTYARYVLARRLERARLLLAQSPKRPVADVAYACGFDSLSTFYRSFRAAFAMSPADFRGSAK